MSKRKTKQQKIKTQLKSLKTQLELSQNPTQTIPSNYKTNLPKTILSQKPTNLRSYDYSYVYKDLLKIFIVATLLVLLEIAVALTTKNESVKLILRSIGFNF